MKKQFSTLVLLGCLPVCLISCDGGSSAQTSNLTVGELATTVADSLDASELRSGDEIYFFTDNATPTRLTTLSLNATGAATAAGGSYTYSKQGERLFRITRSAPVDAQARLDIALFNLLSGNAGATLGSNFRTLIRRDTPNFNETELNELIRILLTQGTNLALTSDGTIVTLNQETHTCLVTSTLEDRDQGTMGGTYFLEASSIEVDFRRPNDSDFATFRFLNNNDWLPVITRIVRPSEEFESGTWNLELSSGLR